MSVLLNISHYRILFCLHHHYPFARNCISLKYSGSHPLHIKLQVYSGAHIVSNSFGLYLFCNIHSIDENTLTELYIGSTDKYTKSPLSSWNSTLDIWCEKYICLHQYNGKHSVLEVNMNHMMRSVFLSFRSDSRQTMLVLSIWNTCGGLLASRVEMRACRGLLYGET